MLEDKGALLREEAELVNDVFGAELVNDTDESVSEGDGEEKEVAVAATDEKNETGENEVDEVKNREGVLRDNVKGGTFAGLVIGENGAFHGVL